MARPPLTIRSYLPGLLGARCAAGRAAKAAALAAAVQTNSRRFMSGWKVH